MSVSFVRYIFFPLLSPFITVCSFLLFLDYGGLFFFFPPSHFFRFILYGLMKGRERKREKERERERERERREKREEGGSIERRIRV